MHRNQLISKAMFLCIWLRPSVQPRRESEKKLQEKTWKMKLVYFTYAVLRDYAKIAMKLCELLIVNC